MKYLFLLIVFLGLVPPHISFALSESDCDIGTETCLCYRDDGKSASNNASTFDNALTLSDSCKETCADWATLEPVTSWVLQCVVDARTTTVASGSVGEESSGYEELEDALTPRLGVEIPGMDPELSHSFFSNGQQIESNLLGRYIEAVYQWLLVAGSLCAVVLMMVGGMQWVTALGDSGKVGKAKERIVKSVFGLVILFGAYIIAFLIDPSTVTFDTLVIKYVDRTEWYPPEEESFEMTYRTGISGETANITGDHVKPWAENNYVNPDLIDPLATAGDALFEETGMDLVITSATRDKTEQAQMFYDSCLKNANGICVPSICNIAYGTGLVTKNANGGYSLSGELADETNSSIIVSTMASQGNVANCPHTSTVAVDVWCADGSMNFEHDPACQLALAKIMIANGFCRINSEAWHFEYPASDPVSRGCSTSGLESYTNSYGSFTPDVADCAKWDFKTNKKCVKEK
ncbi:MAG: hypothetical protein WC730_01685 [Patescibacteria group bacterium]|jgi:D-alanyl-D-alanine dipeptidase